MDAITTQIMEQMYAPGTWKNVARVTRRLQEAFQQMGVAPRDLQGLRGQLHGIPKLLAFFVQKGYTADVKLIRSTLERYN